MSDTHFISINEEVSLPDSVDWNAFILEVCAIKNIGKGHFDFNFVSKPTLKKLNQAHLNRDYDTDIISFNLGSETDIIGDVYISVDQARENANTYGNTFIGELKLLITHGILHLLGYTDYTDKDRQIMEDEQNRILEEIHERR